MFCGVFQVQRGYSASRFAWRAASEKNRENSILAGPLCCRPSGAWPHRRRTNGESTPRGGVFFRPPFVPRRGRSRDSIRLRDEL